MKKQITVSLLAAILLIFSANTTIAQKQEDRNFQITKSLNTQISLFRELNRLYVDTIDPEKLMETGIKAMLSSLDPYTVFYPESNLDEVKMMTTGEYGGIGAVISKRDSGIIIREPYTGTPSMNAGLLPGDIILSINGISMLGKTASDATDILRGPVGDELILNIKREGKKPFDINLKRQKVQLPNIPFYDIIKDSIGYISLSSFTETSAIDVRNAALDLKKRGAKSLILDLRNNGGGLLDQAVDIVGMFVPKGSLVVTTKGKVAQMEKSLYTTQNPILPDIPLAVLINSNSASASEIVSGALQDMDRAILVGELSYGKGLVQSVRELPYNTKLKVTTAKYYIPSGRCIQAIDYSHRDEDGSVGTIPDSLRKAFKTKGGRTVYDGGGVTPDYTINEDDLATISQELVLKDIMFDFVNSYALKHDAPVNLLDYKLTDDVYNEFKEYAIESNFQYATKSSRMLEILKKSTEEEKYYEKTSTILEDLKKELEPNCERDMETFKEEIKELLTDHFLTRYYNNEGYLEYTIKNSDPYTEKAILEMGNIK